MRLNLPRRSCIHFAILGEFTVSSRDADAEIQAFMDQTETRTLDLDGEETRVAIFGSRSKIGGTTYGIRGSLYRSVGEENATSYQLSIVSERASDELPPPPAAMRRVSHLVEASSRLFGPIEMTCYAVFEYDETAYRSKVSFPFPLIVQSEQLGVTHVEEAQFSRRKNGDVQYRISVSKESPSITHSVDFETTAKLDGKSIAQLLDKARSFSSQLVVPIGDERDVHS